MTFGNCAAIAMLARQGTSEMKARSHTSSTSPPLNSRRFHRPGGTMTVGTMSPPHLDCATDHPVDAGPWISNPPPTLSHPRRANLQISFILHLKLLNSCA